ncbi:glycosyltransferase family 2 protein [Niallia alba]|uniref:Glycosyltransferase family 2 protein n=1 Tax=Niallia alba TaxID=2729105 RepID=A0A7Y0KCF7_9BACI|nr:glycosyltransferase family A protein [Niallia alba]NMO79573.1 glycosyltransferase family 2 protein [Niallia alba]
MNNPLISIIIPVYNVEEYLERCINSVLSQTYKNFEVIAINDGSTDNSLKILEDLALSDNRIFIYNKENGGQASARNLGLKKVKGDYLIMVDSDDYIDEHLLEKCMLTVKSTNCDLVLFDRLDLNERGELKYCSGGSGITMTDACSAPWNKFYKATLWEGCLFPEGYWYEDLGIVPVIVAKAKKIVNINEPLYIYERSREGSQTNQLNVNKILDVQHMLSNVYEKITDLGLLEKSKKQLEILYIEHLIYITILEKLTQVKDKNIRANLIDEIKVSMAKKFPNWKQIEFASGGMITKRVKNLVVTLYLNKNFVLGDLIWKTSLKLKRKFY